MVAGDALRKVTGANQKRRSVLDGCRLRQMDDLEGRWGKPLMLR